MRHKWIILTLIVLIIFSIVYYYQTLDEYDRYTYARQVHVEGIINLKEFTPNLDSFFVSFCKIQDTCQIEIFNTSVMPMYFTFPLYKNFIEYNYDDNLHQDINFYYLTHFNNVHYVLSPKTGIRFSTRQPYYSTSKKKLRKNG